MSPLQRKWRSHGDVNWLLAVMLLLGCCTQRTGAALPLYALQDNSLGGPCWSSKAATVHTLRTLSALPESNTFHRLVAKRHFRSGAISPALKVIPGLFDFLEPLENLWEFYTKRDEIMEEMISRSADFAKRRSVRFIAYFVGIYATLDVLARLGVFGKRGTGIIATLRASEYVGDTLEEKFFQKIARDSFDIGVAVLTRFRRFGGKSKFAVAFSAGALFYQTAIQTTTAVVKITIGSFMLLETLSFIGVIGEPGESIVEWIEDKKADKEWNKCTKARLRKVKSYFQSHLSFEKLEEFYQVAVDEEKVACMGFAIGSLFAIF